ncbi:H-NS histone family protein [Lysobacter yananisis]|jgi:DNA-binding protein H-NS|uniref:H-NS histone family protein n=1 Tax=Lysobacter yananisis TaxID=1003114 RepID=A0ABY9PAU9_9GAMM|nr:H-NS histone family protein [Lysobacter yananisis]WMT04161.1 H-NS histone family protein [Lysobacter yananisis]
MNIDIDRLNLRELTALLTAAEKRQQFLSKRRPAASVRKQAVALAARHGYTIEELFGDQPDVQPTRRKRGSRRKPAKVAPKYRDPDNELNTWSGRGSMPRWLAKKIRFGQHATDFLIPGIAKPTARTASSIGKRTLVKPG